MSLSVLPALPEDIPTLIDIYFASFQNLLALNGFPDIPPVRRWWTDMIKSEFGDPNALFLKVTRRQKTGEDEIIAWAKWCGPAVDDGAETGLPTWPEGGDHALCNEFFGKLAKKHKEMLGKRRHWYLELLATHVSHQGKGAGSLLIKHALQYVDADGIEAYLEASPVSVSLYKRFGFEPVDQVKVMIHGEEYINTCMVRQAQRIGA